MAAIGMESLISGSLFSANSAAYSWRRIRLKAVPILDLLSHATLGVPRLPRPSLCSAPRRHAPGDGRDGRPLLHGQPALAADKDFEVDGLAGVRNTTLLLGVRRAKVPVLALLAGASASYVWLVAMLPIPNVASLTTPIGDRTDGLLRGVGEDPGRRSISAASVSGLSLAPGGGLRRPSRRSPSSLRRPSRGGGSRRSRPT